MKVVLIKGRSYRYDDIKAVQGVPVEVSEKQGKYLVSTGQFVKVDTATDDSEDKTHAVEDNAAVPTKEKKRSK